MCATTSLFTPETIERLEALRHHARSSVFNVCPIFATDCHVREELVVEKESSSSTEDAVVQISGVSRRRVMAQVLDRCCFPGFHNQW